MWNENEDISREFIPKHTLKEQDSLSQPPATSGVRRETPVFSRNGINLRCKSGREDSRKRNGAVIEGGLKKREKEKKKWERKENYRAPISSSFLSRMRCMSADLSLPEIFLGALIHRRMLDRGSSPNWIHSPSERLDSVRDRKVNRSAPLNRVR